MDLSYFVPHDVLEKLHWLGNVRNWYRLAPVENGDGVPRTKVWVNWDALETASGVAANAALLTALRRFYTNSGMMSVAYMEALSRAVADGPKLFAPTDEQWESMEHVELRIHPRDFRSPYPAFVVRVPLTSRKRLAAEFGVPIDRVAQQVLLRQNTVGGTNHVFVVVPLKDRKLEEFFMFSDQPSNPDIETVFNRRVQDGKMVALESLPADEQVDRNLTVVVARAACNLCLMLAHYGHGTGGPLWPVEYRRHRAKKHLARYKHADYLTVNMKQHVVVRRPNPPTDNPPGPGTGIELAPHWRKGHWRAYPGQGVARAAGNTVPLLFVRPCLVRSDRVSGDVAESEVVYDG